MSTINIAMAQIATVTIPNSYWGNPYMYPYNGGIVLFWFVGERGAICVIKPNGQWCIFYSIWSGNAGNSTPILRFDGARLYYAYQNGCGIIDIPNYFENGAIIPMAPFIFNAFSLPPNITTQTASSYIIDGPWMVKEGVGIRWHVVDSCINVVYYYCDYSFFDGSITNVTVSNGASPYNWQTGTVFPKMGYFMEADGTKLYLYNNIDVFLSNTKGTLTTCPNPLNQFSINALLIGYINHGIGGAYPLSTDITAIGACTDGHNIFVYSKPFGISQIFYSAAPGMSGTGTALSDGFFYTQLEASPTKLYIYKNTVNVRQSNWPVLNNANIGPMDHNPLLGNSPLVQLNNNRNYLINHSRPVSAIGKYKS